MSTERNINGAMCKLSTTQCKSVLLIVTCLLQGTDRLTLTWKLDEGIHIHVDIKEQNKPNQFSLGRSLWIGNDVNNVFSYLLSSVYMYSYI